MDYSAILAALSRTPELYAESTSAFWDDEHISKGMLEAHLSPNTDAASRKPDFLDASAKWLRSLCVKESPALLDLGCGPGLYAERLTRLGFAVTGVDISRRSLTYAEAKAKESGLSIRYLCCDYTRLAFEAEFDLCILIYDDYGVLSPENRRKVLGNARRALRKGGLLILDAYTPARLRDYSLQTEVYHSGGGFWTDREYAEISRHFIYPETRNYCDQSIIITEDKCEVYNIWNQIYTRESLARELEGAGFGGFRFFGDVRGGEYSDDNEDFAVVAERV
jgi:SAM-dependent methyltransferase